MKHITTIAIAVFITIGTASQCLKTEEEFKTYFKNNEGKLDPIEGIWLTAVDTSLFNPDSVKSSMKLFIIKTKNHFSVCRISDGTMLTNKITNEKFIKKKKAGKYIYSNYSYYKSPTQHRQNGNTTTAPAVLTNNRLTITTERRVKTSVTNPNHPGTFIKELDEYIKLFPK